MIDKKGVRLNLSSLKKKFADVVSPRSDKHKEKLEKERNKAGVTAAQIKSPRNKKDSTPGDLANVGPDKVLRDDGTVVATRPDNPPAWFDLGGDCFMAEDKMMGGEPEREVTFDLDSIRPAVAGDERDEKLAALETELRQRRETLFSHANVPRAKDIGGEMANNLSLVSKELAALAGDSASKIRRILSQLNSGKTISAADAVGIIELAIIEVCQQRSDPKDAKLWQEFKLLNMARTRICSEVNTLSNPPGDVDINEFIHEQSTLSRESLQVMLTIERVPVEGHRATTTRAAFFQFATDTNTAMRKKSINEYRSALVTLHRNLGLCRPPELNMTAGMTPEQRAKWVKDSFLFPAAGPLRNLLDKEGQEAAYKAMAAKDKDLITPHLELNGFLRGVGLASGSSKVMLAGLPSNECGALRDAVNELVSYSSTDNGKMLKAYTGTSVTANKEKIDGFDSVQHTAAVKEVLEIMLKIVRLSEMTSEDVTAYIEPQRKSIAYEGEKQEILNQRKALLLSTLKM